MNQEERKLRSLIRKGIHIIQERKEQQKNEEKRKFIKTANQERRDEKQ